MPTYKQVTAILLLLLYGFITAPVQLWHDHFPADEISRAQERSASVCDGNGSTTGVSGDCSICAHQYAACTGEAPGIVLMNRPAHVAGNDFLLIIIPAAFPQQHFNKGPPFLS